MSDLILIILATVLVNNFVLVKFLGLCPLLGASTKFETTLGMSLATTFVLTLAFDPIRARTPPATDLHSDYYRVRAVH